MSIELAEQALDAAEKAFGATCFDPASDMLVSAQRMWRAGIKGRRATADLLTRIDRFSARSLDLHMRLRVARSALPRAQQ